MRQGKGSREVVHAQPSRSRQSPGRPVTLSAATSAMASQMAGTAGSWLRACCRAAAAGPLAPCSAVEHGHPWGRGRVGVGGWRGVDGGRSTEPCGLGLCTLGFEHAPSLLFPRALACVEARQGHPGGHTLGVQLQRAAQRELAHRWLHRWVGAGHRSWGRVLAGKACQRCAPGRALRPACRPR